MECNIQPLTLPHATTKDDIYQGYHIPEGSVVVINAIGLNHDPDIYEEPEKFKPERFLDESGRLKATQYIYEPWAFSEGRRSCIGSALALRKMLFVIGHLLTLFSLELDKDSLTGLPIPVSLEGQGSSFDWMVKNFKVKFVPRQEFDVDAILQEE
ncbi:hypothetical protein G9A89_008961 [Geosiphon pyriformis]|nr:hypothetical protein G9A89_008961 [Geosiphon pyriformis]